MYICSEIIKVMSTLKIINKSNNKSFIAEGLQIKYPHSRFSSCQHIIIKTKEPGKSITDVMGYFPEGKEVKKEDVVKDVEVIEIDGETTEQALSIFNVILTGFYDDGVVEFIADWSEPGPSKLGMRLAREKAEFLKAQEIVERYGC